VNTRTPSPAGLTTGDFAESWNGPARFALFALLALIFGLLREQRPFFWHTQNTYLLLSFAPSLPGLAEDWLTTCTDPQPVFTWLTQLALKTFGPRSLFLLQAGLAAIVFASLWSLVRSAGLRLGTTATWIWIAGLLLLTAAIDSLVPAQLHRLLDYGVAKQHVLGPMYQPSGFGALLMAGLAFGIAGRRVAAGLALAAAATVHPTYALSAGILALALGLEAWRGADGARGAVTMLGVTGLALLPIALHTLGAFGSADAELAARAAQIIVHERIPHHVLPWEWLSVADGLRIAIVIAAALFFRAAPIGRVIGAAAVISFIGVVATASIGSDRLLMLMPHRISVVLVPTSLAVWLAWLAAQLERRLSAAPRVGRACMWAAIAISLGIALQSAQHWKMLVREPIPAADAVTDAVAQQVPLGSAIAPIPPDLRHDLRMGTGRAVFADEKSHPYAPAEVLIWWERVRVAKELWKRPSPASLTALLQLQVVSHLLVRDDWLGLDALSSRLQVVWSGEGFAVVRVGDAPAAASGINPPRRADPGAP
jgi:hypothetical protein